MLLIYQSTVHFDSKLLKLIIVCINPRYIHHLDHCLQ